MEEQKLYTSECEMHFSFAYQLKEGLWLTLLTVFAAKSYLYSVNGINQLQFLFLKFLSGVRGKKAEFYKSRKGNINPFSFNKQIITKQVQTFLA